MCTMRSAYAFITSAAGGGGGGGFLQYAFVWLHFLFSHIWEDGIQFDSTKHHRVSLGTPDASSCNTF